ncbi:MAG: ribosome-associated translation inhibitor RaiA [Candidatus Sungbacteria bacterium]|nr:ribosome-associated translation inhibitor RaiA [Candidatus Sungbacteria bacterium]
MRVTLRQKNLEITPALRVYIESKLLKSVRRLMKNVMTQSLPILDLEFGRSTRHHRKGRVYHAEANLTLDGTLLRAEVDDEDIRAACDLLAEELEREIVTYKSRARARERRGSRRVKKDLHLDPAARLYRRGRIRNEGN